MAKMGYPNVLRWAKLITITGLYQIIVQALGFVCGILVIRMLSMEEYALYTLANTILGTMSVLSDGGISSAVMAQGGKVWTNKEKLGNVLETGLVLRRQFAIVSLIIVTPLLIYLLHLNGASFLTISLIYLAVLPAFYFSLSDTLLEIIPKLHQSLIPLQKNQISVAAFRLALSAVIIYIFPLAFVAIVANGIPRYYGNIKLRLISNEFITKNSKPDPEVRKSILVMVWRTLPGAIYFSLSAPISIWLISFYGNAHAVAQIGALGRVALALTTINILISTIIIPRFARINEDKDILLKYFIKIMASLFLMSIMTCWLVCVFSDQILWILSGDYEKLRIELLLSIAGACINLMTGVSYGLYTARGWAIKPEILVVVNCFSMVFLLLINKINTLLGVLIYSLELALIGFLLNGLYCLVKIKKI